MSDKQLKTYRLQFMDIPSFIEAISKKGFWFKFKAVPNFNPEAYCGILRS